MSSSVKRRRQIEDRAPSFAKRNGQCRKKGNEFFNKLDKCKSIPIISILIRWKEYLVKNTFNI